jgi:hypothetical protein
MNGRLALSLSVAALILAVGGLFAVHQRLGKVEGSLASRERAPSPPPRRAEPPAELPGEAPPADIAARLDRILEILQEASDHAYDSAVDTSGSIHALNREVASVKAILKQIVQGMNRPGGPLEGMGWALAPRGARPDAQRLADYRKAAEAKGIRVEEGRVTVRGFVNMSPDARMPIEYFVTRYPEANHETLVHVVGDHSLEELREDPYRALEGIATALYKGLVAAGFAEGTPSHPDPEADPKDPRWIVAAGEPLYLYVRYERKGRTHLARATDWVIEDPAKGTVLPEGCFRFTGSVRGEHPDTGDEFLSAEQMGLLVSVWPNARALVEISLESALRNEYAYNFSRIPKPDGEGPLFVDLVFSRAPMEPEGEGKGGGG